MLNCLFLMDPIVDFDSKFDDRSAIALKDLCAIPLGRAQVKHNDISVYFLGLKSLLNKKDLRKQYEKSNIKLFEIDDLKIEEALKQTNSTINQVYSGECTGKCNELLSKIIFDKIKNFTPNIVIYWESCSDLIRNLFKNSVFLELSRSGLYRVEGSHDVFISVEYKNQEISIKDIESLVLSKNDYKDIELFKETFKEIVAWEGQITREYLDPEGKFKNFVFYGGNFPSLKFYKYTKGLSNDAIIRKLLSSLPNDCAILYSRHHIDSNDININDNRLIDLNKFKVADDNISIRALKISDAHINVYSNLYMIANILEIPSISLFKSNNSLFHTKSIDSIESINKYLDIKEKKYNKELSDKILFYILTRKLNISFLNDPESIYLYIKLLYNNILSKKPINWIPIFNTVRGYTGEFEQNILLKRNRFNSYSYTRYDFLKKVILDNNIKNIGFDVFDTLLVRATTKPVDIFEIMEDSAEKIINKTSVKFSQIRRIAEKIARKDHVEITIIDIYSRLASLIDLSREQINKLINLEIEIEKKLLFPRISLLNIFSLAKIYGKKIFIASDMYHDEITISQFLESNGYDLNGINLYISCEENSLKSDGTLFLKIIEKEKILKNETLFIGDNLNSDYKKAIEIGFSALLYPKCYDLYSKLKLFDNSLMGLTFKSNHIIYTGLIANKLFDNPFIDFDYNSICNNSQNVLGYAYFGPLIISIIKWLLLNAINYDEILFSSRDSKIIVDVYNNVRTVLDNKNTPIGRYIQISRTATLPLYMDKIHSLNLASLYNSDLKVSDFLEKIFKIDVNNNKKLVKESKLDINSSVSSSINELSDFFSRYFELNPSNVDDQKNIMSYFSEFICNKKIAIFDLGAKGTSRDILQDLFNKQIDLFLFRTSKYKIKNNINSYMCDHQNMFRHGVKAILPQFYEVFLSDKLNETCKGYVSDQKGNIKADTERAVLDKSSIIVLESQAFMRKFCSDYLKTYTNQAIDMIDLNKDPFILPLSYISAGYTDIKLMSQINGNDPYWSKNISVVSSFQNTTGAKPISNQKKNEFVFATASDKIRSSIHLIDKLEKNPNLYFMDSNVYLLKRLWIISNYIPLLGKLIKNIMINNVKKSLEK